MSQELLGAQEKFWLATLAERALWRGKPSASPLFSYKSSLTKALQHRSLFDAPREPESLIEIDAADCDLEAFLELSRGYRRPVVIRGFAADTVAAQRWNLDYLNERLAGQSCTALVLDEKTREGDWDHGAPIIRMSFAEYFERMVDEDIYLNASSELATAAPALVEEIELDRIGRTFREPGRSWDELVLLNFFIGASRVFSALHTAPAGNFFLNITGRKRWMLVDPRYSALLFPVTKPPFQYFRSAYGGWRDSAARGEEGVNILWRVPRYEVVLQPGDLLYNAPWWWHEVNNLDDLTIGCAVRRIAPPFTPSPTWANQPWMTASSLYPFGRAAASAHYVYQQISGDREPLRDRINALNTKIIRSTLRDQTEAR